MTERQRAKLFMHGGSQAVRLPKAFRFEGTEVIVSRAGEAVILEPVKTDLKGLWSRLDAKPKSSFPTIEPAPPGKGLEWDE